MNKWLMVFSTFAIAMDEFRHPTFAWTRKELSFNVLMLSLLVIPLGAMAMVFVAFMALTP